MTMNQNQPRSIVVGIDGSEAAKRAAAWAVDEAISRDVPLRLLHVIEPGSEAVRLETGYAQAALRTARAAVDATGKQVGTEMVVVRGDIGDVLAEESRRADLICVGSFGVNYPSRKLLGSVADALVQSAHCPAAVIRTPNIQGSESSCIAVVVGDPNTVDAVLRVAIDEARLRNMPLLLLRVWPVARGNASDGRVSQRLAGWGRRYPDVAVHPVAVYTNRAEFLTATDQSVLLAIVDTAGGDEHNPAIGPSVVSRAYCSVIVVRPEQSRWSAERSRSVNGTPTREMAQ